MAKPTKAELIALVCELGGVASQLYSEYSNDTRPGRADAMSALSDYARQLVEDCMARISFDEMQGAVERFDFNRPDTKAMRNAHA